MVTWVVAVAGCATTRGPAFGVAFSDRADLSGAVPGGGLAIQGVIEQALIDVFELGTEAAAATGVIEGMVSDHTPPPADVVFHADHPFAYVLRDTQTGVVLFLKTQTAGPPRREPAVRVRWGGAKARARARLRRPWPWG